MYTPNPIKTDTVALPEDIKGLMEKLSENAHENWSQQRIKEGWTYGDERNDEKKTHPGLVPYDQLTEGEKEYDRILAEETLKTIMSLGYCIIKNNSLEVEQSL